MAEMHIRVNKRSLERTFFLLVIIVLAVLLVWRWDASAAPAGADDLTQLEAQVATLSSENVRLSQELNETQHELELINEADAERDTAVDEVPEETPAPTSTLSGEIETSWTVRADSEDALDRVTVSVKNGLDSTQELTYRLYWDDFYESTTFKQDTFTVQSGKTWTEHLVYAGEGFTSNPPSDITTLVIEIKDTDGDLIEKLEKEVR